MKFDSVLYLINDINEKFEENSAGLKSNRYYEVLHSSLSLIVREWTEAQYNSIPLPQRKTIEKLESDILKLVSKEYLDGVKQFEEENGKFRKETKEGKTSKIKHTIGFTSDFEEGTTI
ncbi:MAG: hypothetical protein IJ415_04010 [Clostridia bacterium]|nr:hypothetical protein [Clostridia bacterium]